MEPPYEPPPTHNGLYGRVFLYVDTLPPDNCSLFHPPPNTSNPPSPLKPLSVGEVGRLNPYHGEDLPLCFTARPRVGGRGGVAPLWGFSAKCHGPPPDRGASRRGAVSVSV